MPVLRSLVVVVASLGLSVAACEKSIDGAGVSVRPSGQLTPDERALLQHLPAGATAVFGGNLFDAQRWIEESPIGKMAAQLSPPAATAWNRCMATQRFAMVGTATYRAGHFSMRFYLRDITVAQLDRCARSSGLAIDADPDGKFVQVQIPTQGGQIVPAPYLAVDGGVYGQTSMAISGGTPIVAPGSRAALEADVAALARGTMADDPALIAILEQLDRRATLWFAGSGVDTPIGDRVGAVRGSMHLQRGLQIDITAEVRDPADIDSALKALAEAKTQLDSMPADVAALKQAVRATRLQRVKDGLRASIALTDQQLLALSQVMSKGMRP